jgi:hypothetical protein
MYFPITDWLPAFVLTLAIEMPIAVAALRGFDRDLARLVLLVLFANLATHLAVWYVITQLLMVGTWQYLLAAEVWAIAAEALIYWAAFGGLRLTRAVAVAGVANLASFAAGRALAGIWPQVFG